MGRREFCAIAVGLVLGLGLAAPAVAGVLVKSGTQITYFAASGEVNSVSISLEMTEHDGVILFVRDDGAAINGTSPCTSAAAGAWAQCPSGAIDVVLGDQNDTFAPFEDRVFPTTVRVWGGDGNDTLIGRDGPQTFRGEDGDDTLSGAGGDDVLDGGTGADTLDGGEGRDEADYSTRTDDITISLDGAANDGWRFTTPPPKQLVTEGDNVMVEVVRTGIGNDSLIGGSLSDHLLAGEGNNAVDGGDGHDFLTSEGGADSLAGGPGLDQIDAGGGNDTVGGGDHVDTLTGGEGADTLNGDAGSDQLSGGTGVDMLIGGAGDDRLTGGADADTLNGGDGFDSMDGGPGGAGDSDVLDGGSDGDFADYRQRGSAVTVDLTAETGHGDGLENDTIRAVENALGGSGGDTLRGDDNNNVLRGFDGDDVLQGRGGNDVLGDRRLCGPSFCLEAEFGADSLAGGAGDDAIFGGAGDDTAIYTDAAARVGVNLSTGSGTGEGTDILYVVENVIGSRYGDVLAGNGRSNILRGGGGADRITGGRGRDTFLGGAGSDKLFAKDELRDLKVDGGRGRDGAKRDAVDPATSIEYRIR